jgi:SAM-dependent methyltransferase
VCERRVPLFLPYGDPRRWRARCPWCGSLERHRLVAFILERENFFGGLGRVLDIGPFAPMTRLLASHGSELVTLDLHNPTADVQAPIEALPFDDASFDTIACMHVLEHLTDDRAGLRELRRVLRSNGRVILQVPLHAGDGPTVEDPAVVDPAERRARFGQHDHVRAYGRDSGERVASAGFAVTETRSHIAASVRERRRFSLSRERDVLYLASAV